MRAEAMTLVGAAAGAAGGRKAMKEKTITVSHEVSPEYGKCSAAGAGTSKAGISDIACKDMNYMPVFCNCEAYEGAEKQRKYYKKDLKFQTIYGKIQIE